MRPRGHPLGALGLHHGALNAVLLPAVLRFNADHIGAKAAPLRAAAGLSPDADLTQWIEDLNHRVEMPAGLAAMGATADQLPEIAAMAATEHLSLTTPRPVSAEDYRAHPGAVDVIPRLGDEDP